MFNGVRRKGLIDEMPRVNWPESIPTFRHS